MVLFCWVAIYIVAVPIGEDLLLFFSVQDSYNKSRRLKFVIRNGVDERTCNLGSFKLQVKIVWKGVFRQRHSVLRVRADELALWCVVVTQDYWNASAFNWSCHIRFVNVHSVT